MNYALYALRSLSASLKAVTRILFDSSTPLRATALPAQCASTHPAPFPFKAHALTSRTTPAKPLRVLRVMEPGQQRSCVGRMVISGRMADVCAELDRLAAREAATL